MLKNKRIYLFLVSILLLLLSAAVLLIAGEPGIEEAEIAAKASTDGLSGISLWLVNLYNEQRVLFSIVTLLTMGIVGISIAFITEIFLKIFGMEVTKIEHNE
jgi:hypothetical protein